jgi:hypothetical protein
VDTLTIPENQGPTTQQPIFQTQLSLIPFVSTTFSNNQHVLQILSLTLSNISISITIHEYYHQFITNLTDAFKKTSTIGTYGSFYNTHTLFVGMVSTQLVLSNVMLVLSFKYKNIFF